MCLKICGPSVLRNDVLRCYGLNFFMYIHSFALKWPLSGSSKIEIVVICV